MLRALFQMTGMHFKCPAVHLLQSCRPLPFSSFLGHKCYVSFAGKAIWCHTLENQEPKLIPKSFSRGPVLLHFWDPLRFKSGGSMWGGKDMDELGIEAVLAYWGVGGSSLNYQLDLFRYSLV
jgi:hypothetical protein